MGLSPLKRGVAVLAGPCGVTVPEGERTISHLGRKQRSFEGSRGACESQVTHFRCFGETSYKAKKASSQRMGPAWRDGQITCRGLSLGRSVHGTGPPKAFLKRGEGRMVGGKRDGAIRFYCQQRLGKNSARKRVQELHRKSKEKGP